MRHSRWSWPAFTAVAVAQAVPVAAAGRSQAGREQLRPHRRPAWRLPTGTITVLASSGLLGTFTSSQLGGRRPTGVAVKFGFGASSTLGHPDHRRRAGRRVRSAAPFHMDTWSRRTTRVTPRTSPFNAEVAVHPVTPADGHLVNDLAKSSVKVALYHPPGAMRSWWRLGTWRTSGSGSTQVTLRPDVKSVLTRGDRRRERGVVYVADVKAASAEVEDHPSPPGENASTLYPIAAVDDGEEVAMAQAFIAYVLSQQASRCSACASFQRLEHASIHGRSGPTVAPDETHGTRPGRQAQRVHHPRDVPSALAGTALVAVRLPRHPAGRTDHPCPPVIFER